MLCTLRHSNEAKHRERFAVRAKYMTLEPTVNKYVKYIRNIRTIQVGFFPSIIPHTSIVIIAPFGQ